MDASKEPDAEVELVKLCYFNIAYRSDETTKHDQD